MMSTIRGYGGGVSGFCSHVSRSLRWQMLTKSMGYQISFMNSFMGGDDWLFC